MASYKTTNTDSCVTFKTEKGQETDNEKENGNGNAACGRSGHIKLVVGVLVASLVITVVVSIVHSQRKQYFIEIPHPMNSTISGGEILLNESMLCEDDKMCPSPMKCIINHCGEPLTMLPCQTSEFCQDLQLGLECCIDFSVGGWEAGAQWERRCCELLEGGLPVIRPPSDITEQQIKKIDTTVKHMANFGLDEMVCKGFEYEMMKKMETCFPYTTTTTKKPLVKELFRTVPTFV